MKYVMPIVLMNTILFLSLPVSGGENCAQLGGMCQNVCRQNEQAEYGAFEDCGEAQECCIVHDASRDQIKCCVSSFDARQYGTMNCSLPRNNLCSHGSGSPVACENLTLCKEKK